MSDENSERTIMQDVPMRLILVGGPRCGKSTYASKFIGQCPVMCADPGCLVKEPVEGVEYLPDEFADDWSGASQYVVDEWLTRPGPWVIEGVATARAMRKWLTQRPDEPLPWDDIKEFFDPKVETLPGQDSMRAGVQTVWESVQETLADLELDI